MVQTPQQRRANEKFAKQETARRGKAEAPVKQGKKFKPPISPLWVGILAFVVGGGLIFELLRLFF